MTPKSRNGLCGGAWTAVSGAAGQAGAGNRLPHARPVDGYSAGRSSPPRPRSLSRRNAVQEPFLLPEKGSKAEISGIFEHSRLTPHVPFPTWGNDAILSMAESGLGVSVLPQLILRRIPYRAAIRPLFSRLS